MADQRLTNRTELSEAPNDADLVHVVDTSDTSDNAEGTSKKITLANFFGNLFNTATGDLDDITAGTTNKHFTATDETKLDGVDTSATANPNALDNVSEDTTPSLGGEMDAGANSIGFTMQTALGTDGTTTLDWGNGNHIDFTFGAFNEVFTFTPPAKAGVYSMSLLQDSVGSRTATFPATVKWAGGSAPTLTTTATTGYDLIAFRFDGTNYYAIATLDFS